MKSRAIKSLLTGAMVGALGASVPAQVIHQNSSKTLSTVAGWSTAGESALDATTDSAGSRYVVGQIDTGSDTDGYIVKLTKKGALTWGATINLGASEASTAVAVDASGNVYVATNHDLTAALQKYDADGNLLWTSAMGVQSAIFDLAINSSGTPLSAGSTFNGTTFVNNAAIGSWPTDGSAATVRSFNSNSAFASIALDSSGNIYGGGGLFNGTFGGAIGFIPASFTGGTLYAYNKSASNEAFTQIAVDPTSQMAVALGYMTGDPTNGTQPFFGTLVGTGAGTGNYGYFTYADGAVGSSLRIAPDGGIFFANTAGVTSGPTYVEIARFTKNTGEAWIGKDWSDIVPEETETADMAAFDLVNGPDGEILLTTISQLVVGTGVNTYAGYNLFNWTGNGDRIDRTVYGSRFQKAPTSYNLMQTSHTTSYSAGYYGAFGKLLNGHVGSFTGSFLEGPDDSYKVREDEILDIGAGRGVLNNDPNDFNLMDISAELVAGSLSSNLKKVTLNPDGSFTAQPKKNKNGIAVFQYNAIQNATIIGTHTVIINIKAVNDAPVAKDNTYNRKVNSALVNLAVLNNDTDVDGDDLTIVSATTSPDATITVSADKKTIGFQPMAGFTGDVVFTYTIKDPRGAKSTATVTVHVIP